MKSCPTCQRTYSDDTQTYCLVDGAVLSAPYDPNQTLQMDPRTTDSPINRPPQQSTIVALQPPKLYGEQQPPRQTLEQHGAPAWLLVVLAVIVIGILGVGVAVGLLLSSTGKTAVARSNSNIAKPTPTPQATPSITPDDDGWEPRDDHGSFNEGERLTYYPGTTPEQCQTDCDANSKCTAYTYIRPGAYNPQDPPMCYLMSEVKQLIPGPCCISAKKR
jgi:hypothetical protein